MKQCYLSAEWLKKQMRKIIATRENAISTLKEKRV